MKCPRCWTEKAYLREVKGWKGVLLAWLLLRPMKCQHCYHEFTVFWISTLGKRIRRTEAKTSSPATVAAPPRTAPDDGAAQTLPFPSGQVAAGPMRRTTPKVRAAQNARFKRAA